MPPNIVIRTATLADAACLGVLATQVFLDTYATDGISPVIAAEVQRSFSNAAVLALITDANSVMRVAERRGHLIGFAQLTLDVPHAAAASARPAELVRLYVQTPFTRQGLGSTLLGDSEAQAAVRGATGLWLTAWMGNARALAFYAAQGYGDVGQAWFEMDDGRHENRVLSKPL